MRHLLIIICVLICAHNAFSQEKKVVELADLLDEWLFSEDSILSYSNISLDISSIETRLNNQKSHKGSYDSLENYLINKYGNRLNYNQEGKILIDKTIKISNSEWFYLGLSGLAFESLLIDKCEFNRLYLNNLEFSSSLQIDNSTVSDAVTVASSKMQTLAVQGTLILKSMWISRNQLDRAYFLNTTSPAFEFVGNTNLPAIKVDEYITGNHDLLNVEDVISSNKFFQIIRSKFEESRIENNNSPELVFMNDGNLGSLSFIGNTFSFFSSAETSEYRSFTMYDNNLINGLSLYNDFIEFSFDLQDVELLTKLVIVKDGYLEMLDNDSIYGPFTDRVISTDKYFNQVLRTYNRFLSDYKAKGYLREANYLTVLLNDLRGTRYEYEYTNDPTFKTYFRWKLNQLLKLYTNHSTDPSLAILMSLYIILLFSLFYLFFPSEWDVTSKTKLIRDFRNFIGRNDKGYISPFMGMLWGLLISMINALTLSMNSFVTLGFGTIPTKGIARYVCILQGFIGWFLLSLFTVTLINQLMI